MEFIACSGATECILEQGRAGLRAGDSTVRKHLRPLGEAILILTSYSFNICVQPPIVTLPSQTGGQQEIAKQGARICAAVPLSAAGACLPGAVFSARRPSAASHIHSQLFSE